MDKPSAILIINLVAEGIGVAKELMLLAQRVKNGETITDEEIQLARIEIDDAISDWDKAKAKRVESKLITNPESE